MEKTEQENAQDLQEIKLLSGEKPQSRAIAVTNVEQVQDSEEQAGPQPEVVQLVQPQEAIDRIVEIERAYREAVERENI